MRHFNGFIFLLVLVLLVLLYLDFSIDALEEVEVVFLECFGGNSSDFLDHVGGDGQSLFLDVGLEEGVHLCVVGHEQCLDLFRLEVLVDLDLLLFVLLHQTLKFLVQVFALVLLWLLKFIPLFFALGLTSTLDTTRKGQVLGKLSTLLIAFVPGGEED